MEQQPGLAAIFRQLFEADDLDSATALAQLLNADMTVRQQQRGSVLYQALDIIRLGKILALYEQFNADQYGGRKAVEQELARNDTNL